MDRTGQHSNSFILTLGRDYVCIPVAQLFHWYEVKLKVQEIIADYCLCIFCSHFHLFYQTKQDHRPFFTPSEVQGYIFSQKFIFFLPPPLFFCQILIFPPSIIFFPLLIFFFLFSPLILLFPSVPSIRIHPPKNLKLYFFQPSGGKWKIYLHPFQINSV